MRLHTSIPPRKDGTVTVAGLDRKTYHLTRGDDGQLSGDVDHEPTVVVLIASRQFWPADEADFDDAMRLAEQRDDGDTFPDDDDDDDDEIPAGGMPVELDTPPAPPKAAKAKAKGGK